MYVYNEERRVAGFLYGVVVRCGRKRVDGDDDDDEVFLCVLYFNRVGARADGF